MELGAGLWGSVEGTGLREGRETHISPPLREMTILS